MSKANGQGEWKIIIISKISNVLGHFGISFSCPLKMCLFLVVVFWKVLIKIYDGNKNHRLIWIRKPFLKLKISQTRTCDIISSGFYHEMLQWNTEFMTLMINENDERLVHSV